MKIQHKVIKKQNLTKKSMRRWQLLASSSLAVAALSLAPSAGFAQSWDGGAADGLYGSAANWNPDGVPVAGGAVTIASAPGLPIGTVTLNGVRQAGTIAIERGAAVPGNFPFPTLSVAGTLTTTAGGATDITLGNGAGLRIVGGGNVNSTVGINGLLNANLDVQAGGTLTGNATLTRGNINVDGTVTGSILSIAGQGNANEIVVGAGGIVGGLVTVNQSSGLRLQGTLNGGLTLNNAHAEVQAGGALNGAVTVTNPGVLQLNATSTVGGNITLNSPGSVLNSNGAINGNLTVADGTVNVDAGTTTLTGNVVNSGRFNVNNGNFSATGTFTNNDEVLLSNGRTLAFGTLTNNDLVRLVGNASATITGNIVGAAGSQINVSNGVIFGGNSLTINGNLTGTNTLAIEGNFATPNGGTADSIRVVGQLDGPLTVNVSPIGVNADILALQVNPIVLVDANSFGGALTDANLTLTGLPQQQGLIIYDLAANAATSDVELRSEVNPAVGDVGAAMSTISSLIGTVINRPSGAFVSGIAFDTPNNCSTGSWARIQGGRIAADTQTRNVTTGTAKRKTAGITEFYGLQGGIDFGCFEDFNGGWDVSGGLLLGMNTGWFSQSSTGASITRGDFDQKFLGAYVAASRGNWSGEIQVRREDGELIFNNPVMSLRNAKADFESTAVSGSVTYRYALEQGWSLLPTAGFAVSRNKVTALTFTTAGGVPLGTMQVEDKTNKTAFVGATLGKTIIDAANASASSHFITATYYSDLTGERDSVFTSAGGIASNTLSTDEVGDFGEVSFGTSYVKVLNSNPGSIRQINASVRTDIRFGSDVQGAGLTAQVRLQF